MSTISTRVAAESPSTAPTDNRSAYAPTTGGGHDRSSHSTGDGHDRSSHSAAAASTPNTLLRHAIENVSRLLAAPCDMGDDDVQSLRDRIVLMERLAGLATAGMAATLAGLRRAGTIKADGAGSTAEWVRANTSRSGRDAARAGRLADNIDELPATANALASGDLTAESADALVKAARDGRLGGPEHVERELLGLATSTTPEQLRADIRQRQHAVDAAAMLRDEAHQRGARRLSLSRRDSGIWDLYGQLPDEVGQQLATALDAFDHPDPDATPLMQRRRPEQRRADAMAALVGVCLDRGLAPGTGGIVRPHISVIVSAPTFSADLGHGEDRRMGGDSRPAIDDPRWSHLEPGELGWGGHLSPQAVRRLSCDAAVSRIVMTASSQVLDIGRATRTWSQPQRRAVNARDRHCRGPNCTRPIGWTQIHHIRWWKRDRGPTNLDNGIALCTHCHHLVHDRGWTVVLDPAMASATWSSPTGRVTVTQPPKGSIATGHILAGPVSTNPVLTRAVSTSPIPTNPVPASP